MGLTIFVGNSIAQIYNPAKKSNNEIPKISKTALNYITTPRNTIVYAPSQQPFDKCYEAECLWMSRNYNDDAYWWAQPSIITIDSADKQYNCMGYAFYTASHPDTKVWIEPNEAQKFGELSHTGIGDGSYNWVSSLSEADIIIFSPLVWDHAALKSTEYPGNLISKWGDSRLVVHDEYYHKYIGNGPAYLARSNDVGWDHANLNSAIQASKPSQSIVAEN